MEVKCTPLSGRAEWGRPKYCGHEVTCLPWEHTGQQLTSEPEAPLCWDPDLDNATQTENYYACHGHQSVAVTHPTFPQNNVQRTGRELPVLGSLWVPFAPPAANQEGVFDSGRGT